MSCAVLAHLRLLASVLLLGLVTLSPLQAHTLIIVAAEMVADGDDLTATLTISPNDIIACLSPKGEATYGVFRSVQQRLSSYLVEHVVLQVDGVQASGRYGGYLPDLLSPANKPADGVKLPEKMPFILLWTLPHAAHKVTLRLTLFVDEGLPGISTLALEPGGTSKRQVAFVELGKEWTFTLHPGSEPTPTAPPPEVPTQPAGSATIAWSVPQALVLGFRHACFDVPQYMLVLVIILLRACAWRPWVWSMVVFAVVQGATLSAVASDLIVPSRPCLAILGCAMVVIAAIITVHPGTGSRWRLVLFAVTGALMALGMGISVNLAVGQGAVPLSTNIALSLGISGAEILVMGLVIGSTVWFWGRPWYQRWLVVPASLVIALAGVCWFIQKAWMVSV